MPIDARPVLATYRYAFTPTRTYFEAMTGRFLYNDTGFRVGVRQWFDDVAIGIFVRRTKFDWAAKPRTFAGIEISLPLTPRKDMSPTAHLQVTGNARWAYGVETVIRESRNLISTGQGVIPNGAILDRTFNFDRSGLGYFEDSMPRIRAAAAR